MQPALQLTPPNENKVAELLELFSLCGVLTVFYIWQRTAVLYSLKEERCQSFLPSAPLLDDFLPAIL
jgi:hypothetical protein